MAHIEVRGIWRQALVVFMFLVQVVLNVLSTSGVIAGTDQSELSDKYRTPITPAGYTFSVWGLIYFCQAVYSVYQALPNQRDDEKLNRIAPWVSLAFALNGSWLIVFSFEYLWAGLFVIVGYLLSLLRTYLLLDPKYLEPQGSSATTILCVWLAFSSNLAWVTVATLLNTTIAFTATFEATSPTAVLDWCIGLIFLAVFITSYYTVIRADPMYTAVTIWAFVGIYNGPYEPPKEFAVAGAIAVAVLFMLGALNTVLQRQFPKAHYKSESPESNA